jgi:hypothetical protein
MKGFDMADNEFMTIYELAKVAGLKNPQSLYSLARQGYLETVEVEVTVTKTVVTKESAAKYLQGRAERAAKAAENQA